MTEFSLGGGGAEGREDQSSIPPETLFHLYSGRSSSDNNLTSRGFELWQTHQLQIERQQGQLYRPSGGQLLAFSDEQVLQVGDSRSDTRTVGYSVRGGNSSGAVSCQDCGNQAKKDCSHMRCRTCCRSRGLDCSTHVKSTWVPAAKRRERQAAASTLPTQSPLRGEPSKRPKAIDMAVTTTTSAGMDLVNFPPEVTSPAVFRCVRVSPFDDTDDQYAYQTAVSIGGHLFKGILYDYGPEGNYSSPSTSTPRAIGESPSSSSAAAAATAIATAVPIVAPTTAGALDPISSLYPSAFSAFMAGTQFFPHHQRP